MSDVTDAAPGGDREPAQAAGPDPDTTQAQDEASGRGGRADTGEAAGPDEAAGTGGERAFEPAAPAPLGVERVPTGRPAVDALLERLGDADHLPADGHLEVYEDVHRGLRDELTSLDAVRPGPSPGP
ncbi:hypothetical protein [Streptomyces sp. NPDC048350]|uniref:hypothetical protein n=1 Tax=Streptomyces sp. NPDC048350 TaxID=3365538 RepID=UPI003711A886